MYLCGFRFKSLRVSHFSEGAGVIGLVTRLHLDSDRGPPTLIAKFPSPAADNRAVARP
ncbi:MAG: hypothetical protein OXF68_08625 [Gammaproteobacteria bacterium]|nr:hypothetical protein [Gammaproteobacteria bacterium]MCY4343575.1 hypothetical protein [Gammaproteobacteria bacterium]